MKLRNAALALVGWYLMLPPLPNHQPDTTAPLQTWEIWRSFDSATDCEQARDWKGEQMLKVWKDPASRKSGLRFSV
jgi:hypothetical protein